MSEPSTAAAPTPARGHSRKNAVLFYSTEVEINSIEIIIGTKPGETIKPDFMADGRLRYRVPPALAERFARHSHVVSGRIKKAKV